MTLNESVRYFSNLAEEKRQSLRRNPLGFFISSLLAGAYVGIGIILIISVGEYADPSLRTLIMGASFSVALTLVVFAGSELFTGQTMYMTFGVLAKKASMSDLVYVWSVVWVGNFLGCCMLALLANMGNIDIVGGKGELLYKLAEKKAGLSVVEMVARGVLCNWLVCLALWTSARTKDDTAKLFLIFWCLFAFIASGFEHSVANMTVFTLALFSEHSSTLTYGLAAKNLFWVTIGNIISGSVFMAGAYWIAGNGSQGAKTPADKGLVRIEKWND